VVLHIQRHPPSADEFLLVLLPPSKGSTEQAPGITLAEILKSLEGVFHKQAHQAVTTDDQVGLGKGILIVSVADAVIAHQADL
jgi:hypothetical protein